MSTLIWKGKDIKTFGDILDATTKAKTPDECQEFMALYRADCPHADENIGYMLGYLDDAEARRIRQWLGPKIVHPIFGDAWADGKKPPSAEEAFEMGKKMGDASKE